MNNVEVILATYNGERFIEEQLVSLIKQTRKPDHIIISDAGSTDATINICKSILARCNIDYTILKSKKKLTPSENFYKGISASVGDVLFFCDQDDYWNRRKIEIMLMKMEEKKADFVFCNAEICKNNLDSANISMWDSIKFDAEYRNCVFYKCNEKYITRLLQNNVVTGMCMCINGHFARKFNKKFKNVLHDEWLAFCSALWGVTFSLDEQLVLYRQHSNNAVGINQPFVNKIKKISHHIIYLEKNMSLLDEICKFDDIPVRIRDDIFDKRRYLHVRINAINNNCLAIFNNIQLYKKYEINPFVAILKDMFCYFRIRFVC